MWQKIKLRLTWSKAQDTIALPLRQNAFVWNWSMLNFYVFKTLFIGFFRIVTTERMRVARKHLQTCRFHVQPAVVTMRFYLFTKQGFYFYSYLLKDHKCTFFLILTLCHYKMIGLYWHFELKYQRKRLISAQIGTKWTNRQIWLHLHLSVPTLWNIRPQNITVLLNCISDMLIWKSKWDWKTCRWANTEV